MKEFNSQICTIAEQSNRLLELGLKPDTADMELVYNIFSKTYEPLTKAFPTSNKYEIPAWSLHRLIELLPQDIHLDDYADTHYYLTIDPFKVIYVNSHRLWIYQRDEGCLYDKLIDTIEWTIKNNFFNKEFLNE